MRSAFFTLGPYATVVAVLSACTALPASARPPRPTVQREVCAVPSIDAGADHSQLAGLDLRQAWTLTRGAGQRVAVLDTGVAPNPRLSHLTAGGDYVSTGDGTQDCDGHGTAVAGIIAATPAPADDFSGVAPDAALIGIRQSSAKFSAVSGSTATGFGDVDTMAQAVRTAADLGASVINISSVACADSALDDRSLGAALSYAVDRRDAVVVAAAGNTGQCPAPRGDATLLVSPARYDGLVLTVGSVNAHGAPSEFTQPGPWVDVAAPGEGVLSLSSSGTGLADALGSARDSSPLSGTSYAAPVVSALAALVRSRFPTWTARQVMQRIIATAHHPPGGRDERVGAGVVDVLAAVSTDSPTKSAAPTTRLPLPVAEPLAATAPESHALRVALTGAAICAGVLALALSIRRLRNILRD